MFENQVSIRTKKVNMINQKIKPFRRQFSQSLSRINHQSSMHTLAKTVYSNKNNQTFTPQKSTSRILPNANPQSKMSSSALSGLDMRASHIPNLSKINTELLIEKKKLEERIQFLKEEIAKQTRLKNRSETTWKTHANHDSYANQAYQQLCKKSAKLNQDINDVKNENNQLNREINQLKNANTQKRNNINQQDENVRKMTNMVNSLKAHLMQEEKQRNHVKAELMKQQRVMDSFSIETKELQNERAMVLLQINNSVQRNKI